MSDTEIDVGRFPHDPALPKGDVLIDIFSRLTDMSDALHDPDGMLQVRLKAQEDMHTRRHIAQMAVLRKILSEVLDIKSRLDGVEDTVEKHGAKFTLLKTEHIEIQ